jgi:hypothetical protein
MNFNSLANIGNSIPCVTRQVWPGNDAPCVARFAQHEPVEAGPFRPVSMSRLDLHKFEVGFGGGVALDAHF